jgi:RNA polymerase sigma-70 factor, ECF subfamily
MGISADSHRGHTTYRLHPGRPKPERRRDVSGHSVKALLREQTDREVLEKIAEGDREALRELYLDYHQRLTAFLLRFTSRRDLVEEVLNDTLYIVWCKAGGFRGDSRLSTWIMGIAYRCVLKTVRRRGHQLSTAVPIENESIAAPDELNAAETAEWVALAMQQLSTDQRLTLELAYGEGYSCEEIAEIMDCPVNTVKTRMFHARGKLRTLLPQLAGTTCAERFSRRVEPNTSLASLKRDRTTA